MNSKTFLSLLFATAVSFISAADERPPNVVLILVDDLGWMDLTCQGLDFYRTPNVDRMDSEGRITQCD